VFCSVEKKYMDWTRLLKNKKKHFEGYELFKREATAFSIFYALSQRAYMMNRKKIFYLNEE